MNVCVCVCVCAGQGVVDRGWLRDEGARVHQQGKRAMDACGQLHYSSPSPVCFSFTCLFPVCDQTGHVDVMGLLHYRGPCINKQFPVSFSSNSQHCLYTNKPQNSLA